jgi:alkylated DNA repair dioxygenase AlkB
MKGIFEEPQGLTYHPAFISEDEEKELIRFFDSLSYENVIIHGQAAKRTVKHFGYQYDYNKVSVEPGEPFPNELIGLKDRCADLAKIPSSQIAQCIISNYPTKSTIGWDTDKFMFGPQIMGVSFNSPCRMQFQRTVMHERHVYELVLAPRSAYIMSGESRYKWQHAIPATPGQRYSITFRTLK